MGALYQRGRASMCSRIFLSLLMLVATIFAASNSADAGMVTIDFTRITSNSADNVEGQLKATLLDQAMADSLYGVTIGTNDVLFTFQNLVGIAAKVHEIYFDDSSFDSAAKVLLSQITPLHNSLGLLGGTTNYAGGGANPANLPSGNNANPNFVAAPLFSADSQGGGADYLDTANDVLGIQFTTIGGGGFDAVKAALESGNLRLGLHVGGIGSDGNSDGFVSNPPDVEVDLDATAPEPASLALMGLGSLLAGCGVVRRKRKQTAHEMMA